MKVRKKGENLTGESPLILPPKRKKQASYASLNIAYRRALKKAGLTKKSMGQHILHPHTLRKWFRTSLEGVLTRSQIERLMGHLSTEYLDGSHFRPPEKDLLEAYRRAIPNLTILEGLMSEELQKQQLIRQASVFMPEEKLRLLKEILARSKTVDEAITEFKRLKDPTFEPTEENRMRLGWSRKAN